VLTLRDATTAEPVALDAARVRLLVVTGADRLTALRAHVVADTARRALDLRGRRAVVATTGSEAVDAEALLALNVPPPDRAAEAGRAGAVIVATSDAGSGGDGARCVVPVGAVRADASAPADPLTTRLALLTTPYRDRVELTASTLDAAAARLGSLRGLVADWAESPSAAPPAELVSRFVAAVEDDLDTPAALDVLDGAAGDPGVPDGARFELFAYADRVLALDLARDVGRPR
jgi:hypothetical protein